MSDKSVDIEKLRLSIIAKPRSCSCQFHASLQNPEQIFLRKSGNFAILPSCPKESDADAEQILAVLWHSHTYYIQVKYSDCCELYIDGNPSRKFASIRDLINFLESGRRVLRLSNGVSVQPRWHCASGQDDLPPHQPWFHPGLSPSKARALVGNHPIGSYLVYRGRKFDAPLVLCVLGEDNQVGIFRISMRRYFNSKQYFISEQFSYPSIGELIKFYTNRSLADPVQRRYKLDTPLSCTAFLAVVARLRVEELLACKGFVEEFEMIRQTTKSPGDEYKSEAKKPENAPKNRYRNVLPFDSTRVTLGECGGYINASWVRLESGRSRKKVSARYIAAQGPLNSTSGDFWQMVWQESCRLIVMVTKEVEDRVRKCHQYWPTKSKGSLEFKSSVTEEPLLVRFVDEIEYRHFAHTLVEVQGRPRSGGEAIRVNLLRFHDWPDHGAPREAGSVLELLKKANNINLTSGTVGDAEPPMVFHCSAGLGRTGCLIAIDFLAHCVNRYGVDEAILDVSQTVKQMRYQREGMVQNVGQYRFIYSALLVHIDSKLRPPLPQEQHEMSRRQSAVSQFCRRLL